MPSTQYAPSYPQDGVTCSCPSCGHRQRVAGKIGEATRCAHCHTSFRLLDRRGRTAPVIATGHPPEPSASIQSPATQDYRPSEKATMGAIPAPAVNELACPYCQERYPLKPVMLGRVLRCRSCRKPFRFSDAGKATMVSQEANAQTRVRTDRLQRQTRDQMRQLSRKLSALADEAAGDADISHGGTLGKRISQADTALTLSGMRHEALTKKTGAKRQTTKQARKPSAAKTRTLSRAPGAQGEISEAILSGSGDSAGRLRKRAALIILIFVLLIGSGWLLLRPNAQQAALAQFDQALLSSINPSVAARTSDRAAYTWPGAQVQAIYNLDAARFTTPKRWEIAQLPSAGLTPIAGGAFWVATEQRAEVESFLQQATKQHQAYQSQMADRLQEEAVESPEGDDVIDINIDVDLGVNSDAASTNVQVAVAPPLPHAALQQALIEGRWRGMSAQDMDAALRSLGAHGRYLSQLFQVQPQHPWFQRDQGVIEQVDFVGAAGQMSFGLGEPLAVDFKGTLVRLVASGDLEQWRVAELQAVGR